MKLIIISALLFFGQTAFSGNAGYLGDESGSRSADINGDESGS